MANVIEIVNLSIILNRYGGGSVTSDGLMTISTKLQNAGSTGLLIIDKPFPNIQRWPNEANAARIDAIRLFNKTQEYGSVLFNVASRRQAVYVKKQTLTVAHELNQRGHATLKQFVFIGADVDWTLIAK